MVCRQRRDLCRALHHPTHSGGRVARGSSRRHHTRSTTRISLTVDPPDLRYRAVAPGSPRSPGSPGPVVEFGLRHISEQRPRLSIRTDAASADLAAGIAMRSRSSASATSTLRTRSDSRTRSLASRISLDGARRVVRLRGRQGRSAPDLVRRQCHAHALTDPWAVNVQADHAAERMHFEHSRRWQARLADAGFMGIAWPAEYGGGGGEAWMTRVHRTVSADYQETTGFAGASTAMLGPALLRHGSEEQKVEFLPKLLSAELTFASCSASPGPARPGIARDSGGTTATNWS